MLVAVCARCFFHYSCMSAAYGATTLTHCFSTFLQLCESIKLHPVVLWASLRSKCRHVRGGSGGERRGAVAATAAKASASGGCGSGGVASGRDENRWLPNASSDARDVAAKGAQNVAEPLPRLGGRDGVDGNIVLVMAVAAADGAIAAAERRQ